MTDRIDIKEQRRIAERALTDCEWPDSYAMSRALVERFGQRNEDHAARKSAHIAAHDPATMLALYRYVEDLERLAGHVASGNMQMSGRLRALLEKGPTR